MRIRTAGWVFAVAAALSAAPGQAQNVPARLTAPAFAQAVPSLPFLFSDPLSGAPTTPVPGFAESPVGPYGRPATPITMPAAPVIAIRPTPLTPNGVLRSNGAIVSPSDSFATIAPQSIPSLGALPAPFTSRSATNTVTGSRRDERTQAQRPAPNNVQTRQRQNSRRDTSVATTRAPLTFAPLESESAMDDRNSVASRENADIARPVRRTPATGASLESLVDALGNPTAVIYEDGGQVLFFNGGVRVFVRDGVVQ